ncbi:cupin domain-containing protein [bacterium]|nr:cupin domain-containing protein [bacterium]
MLEITLQRLNDRPRAETIQQRGLLRLTSEEGRATLTRVYEALLTQPVAPDTTPLTARSKAASTAAATARPGTPSPDQPDLLDRSIRVEHNPYPTKLERLGVKGWPIWEKEISEFPWHYDDRETCYLLEGDVTVTPDGGGAHRFGKGDLVTFPKGLSCTWKIHVPVRKHYRFG